MNRRLYRSRTDTMLGGVAGGVADYLDIDPTIVRIIWAVLAVMTAGFFVVLYLVMWIVVPEAPLTLPTSGQAAAGTTAAPEEDAAASAQTSAWAPPPEPARPWQRGGSGAGPMIVGLILIGIGAWFLLREFVPGLDTDLLWPIALVVLGVVLLVISLQRRDRQ